MISPLILSGPSGVGKTYLEKYLIEHHNFKRIQSTTTRPQRQNEINGVDYNFITEEEYKQWEEQGKFITSIHNLNAWYGFEKSLVEEIIEQNKIPITISIPQLLPQFLKAYPTTIAIYLLPESKDLLIKRMKLRGDPEEKMQQRLKYADEEIAFYENNVNHLYKTALTMTEENFEEAVQTILKLSS